MPPKTQKASGQQSLKASWSAAKNAKAAVRPVAAKKEAAAAAPIVPSVKETVPAPKPAQAKVAKRPIRKSLTTDEDSDIEGFNDSSAEDSDQEHVSPIEETSPEEDEKPQLNVKDKKVNAQLRQVIAVSGATIHTKAETEIDKALRRFDLSYEYGPCVGFTRLERWERAHSLDLNPPIEIRNILLTQQGQEDEKYKEPVFNRRV